MVEIRLAPIDPVAEQLGVLLGQRDDGHPAHRVADQHDVAVGGDLVDHPLEVAAELVDRGVAAVERPDRPWERWS